MFVTAELCIIPMGTEPSVSSYIAHCSRLIQQSGLKHSTHAYGTNIEGEWDDVMAVVRQCHESLHNAGVPRLFSTLKIGTRTDKNQSLQNKLDSLDAALREP